MRQSIANLFAPFTSWKFGAAIQDHRRVMRILEDNKSVLNYTVFQTPSMDSERPFGTTYKAGSPEQVPGMSIASKVGIRDAADACLQLLLRDATTTSATANEDGSKFLNLIYTKKVGIYMLE